MKLLDQCIQRWGWLRVLILQMIIPCMKNWFIGIYNFFHVWRYLHNNYNILRIVIGIICLMACVGESNSKPFLHTQDM